jgi:hypothetical protein
LVQEREEAMRKLFWWAGGAAALLAAGTLYCCLWPDSFAGRCLKSGYEATGQLNPLYHLRRRLEQGQPPAHGQDLPPDALAQAREEPRPCDDDQGACAPAAPLAGAFQIPAPIVIQDDDLKDADRLPPLPDDPPLKVAGVADPVQAPAEAIDHAGFQVKGDDRPMSYCDDDKGQPPPPPMTYAEENAEPADETVGWLRRWIDCGWVMEAIGARLDGDAPPMQPKAAPAEPMMCPHCPGCPACPASACPPKNPYHAAEPTMTPTGPGQADGEEACETGKPEPRKSKKASRILQAPLRRSLQEELHPRRPDVDTMEFGKRDWTFNDLGMGPVL